MPKVLKVGLIGCGWISEAYAESFRLISGAEVVACCAESLESSRAFARKHGIPAAFEDPLELLRSGAVDAVTVGVPNHLHHPIALAALAAGKHVLVEKPLALSLEQGREMLAAAKKAGRTLAYAENACFIPAYARARRAVVSGSLGEIKRVRQVEAHDGPHSRWFFDRSRAGGGALMDMGCHSIALARWLLGKPKALSVEAALSLSTHAERTELEDHAVLDLAFEGGAEARLECGWTSTSGMVSWVELEGTKGTLRAELPGEASLTQSGYPQELARFLEDAAAGAPPAESAEDGLAVLEVMLAAYRSAGTSKRVTLPYRPRGVRHPADLWKKAS